MIKSFYAIIVIAIVVIAGMIISSPALAYDPPAAPGDNVTDVRVWPSSNVTLNSVTLNPVTANVTATVTVTAPDAEKDLESVIDHLLEGIRDFAKSHLPLVFVVIANAFAFFGRDRTLCIVAAFGTGYYAFWIWSDFHEWSILFALWAGVDLIKAFRDKDYWRGK